MKKLLILFLIVILLFPAVHSNDLNWKVGDYWEYEVINFVIGKETKYNEKIRVVGKENISYYGKNYFVYLVEINRPNVSLTSFYRVGDLAYVGVSYNNYSIISYPPVEKYRFLKGGKKWNQSVVWIENIGGNIYNISFTIHFECLGEEKIKTKAGKFKCYIIKSYANQSGEYNIEYFSPFIKNIALSISYRNGEISSKRELIKTSYKENRGIPSFIFPSIIFSFLLNLLLKKIGKRKNQPRIPNHHR